MVRELSDIIDALRPCQKPAADPDAKLEIFSAGRVHKISINKEVLGEVVFELEAFAGAQTRKETQEEYENLRKKFAASA